MLLCPLTANPPPGSLQQCPWPFFYPLFKQENEWKIADSLQAIQLHNSGELCATIRHHGQHIHESCMAIAVERHNLSGLGMSEGSEATATEALRDLARWLCGWLESDYEWQTSDVVTDQSIIAGEYTFTRSGQRFG